MPGPTRAYAHGLHERLLQGDPIAPAEIAEALLEPLVYRLRARTRHLVDDPLVYDAVTDALLTYLQQPGKFDPNKSSLLSYLTMAAHGDLRNNLARERRRKQREVALDDVEHRLFTGNEWGEEVEDGVLDRLDFPSDSKGEIVKLALAEFPDEQDRRLLSLMMNGERKTAAYVNVLGIERADPDEQRRTVKRHKDRLTKRLERLGSKLREHQQNG